MRIKKSLLAILTVVTMLSSTFVSFASTNPTIKTTFMDKSEIDAIFTSFGSKAAVGGVRISLENLTDKIDSLQVDIHVPSDLQIFGQTSVFPAAYGTMEQLQGEGPDYFLPSTSYSVVNNTASGMMTGKLTPIMFPIITGTDTNKWSLQFSSAGSEPTEELLIMLFCDKDGDGKLDATYDSDGDQKVDDGKLPADFLKVSYAAARYLGEKAAFELTISNYFGDGEDSGDDTPTATYGEEKVTADDRKSWEVFVPALNMVNGKIKATITNADTSVVKNTVEKYLTWEESGDEAINWDDEADLGTGNVTFWIYTDIIDAVKELTGTDKTNYFDGITLDVDLSETVSE